MSRGKYLSLEEARNYGELERFAGEHPSEGDRRRFERLFASEASGTTFCEMIGGRAVGRSA